MYLLETKPEKPKGEWDLLKVVATIPANEAFRPVTESDCPLLKAH
jgi:branched-chain amino acid transport system substrate-binding protein